MPGPPSTVSCVLSAEGTAITIASLSSPPLTTSCPVNRLSNPYTVTASLPAPAAMVSLVTVEAFAMVWVSPHEHHTWNWLDVASSLTSNVSAFEVPVIVISVALIVTGSSPAYVITSAPRVIVPDCGPVNSDATATPGAAFTTIVSKPPSPPSTVPASEPLASNTNVSRLSGAPAMFSTPVNASASTLPAPGPSIVHVVSGARPAMVSKPAPPSNAIGMPSAAAEPSSVSVSAPSLPVIVTLRTSASGRRDSTPSIVTTRSVPSTVREIVCCPAPAVLNEASPAVMVDADASSTEACLLELAPLDVAGGEGPLPGTAVGSRGGSVALSGASPLPDAIVSTPTVEPGVEVWETWVPPAAVAPPAGASASPLEPAGTAETVAPLEPSIESVDASGSATEAELLVEVVSTSVDCEPSAADATGASGPAASAGAAKLSSPAADSTGAAADDAGAAMQTPAEASGAIVSGAAVAAASALSGTPLIASAAEPPPATPGGAPREMPSISA